MQKHRIAEFNIARKKATMQAVDAFMKANAYASAKDCAQELGMNYGSVCRYIKELKAQNEKEKNKE